MLRIGKLTDYATVILATLAADRARLLNAGTLAERTHIAAPTVSKLLKQLHRAGPGEFRRAARTAATSSPATRKASAPPRFSTRWKGPIALTECSAGSGHCGIEHTCSVGRTWQRLNLAIRRSLSEISLAQLAGLDNRTPTMPIERELRTADAHARRLPEQ